MRVMRQIYDLQVFENSKRRCRYWLSGLLSTGQYLTCKGAHRAEDTCRTRWCKQKLSLNTKTAATILFRFEEVRKSKLCNSLWSQCTTYTTYTYRWLDGTFLNKGRRTHTESSNKKLRCFSYDRCRHFVKSCHMFEIHNFRRHVSTCTSCPEPSHPLKPKINFHMTNMSSHSNIH